LGENSPNLVTTITADTVSKNRPQVVKFSAQQENSPEPLPEKVVPNAKVENASANDGGPSTPKSWFIKPFLFHCFVKLVGSHQG
jgi:hypothetical protein